MYGFQFAEQRLFVEYRIINSCLACADRNLITPVTLAYQQGLPVVADPGIYGIDDQADVVHPVTVSVVCFIFFAGVQLHAGGRKLPVIRRSRRRLMDADRLHAVRPAPSKRAEPVLHS
ncbi:hypothetical protein D3C73_1251190 [compost metagenome]